MAQPIQEPSTGREIEGLAYRSRQLFRRPSPAPDIPTAAFLFGLPVASDPLGEQSLENISTWTSLLIDPDFAFNYDQIIGGDAVRLEDSDDGVGSRMVFETADSQLVPDFQYWLVGGWVSIGGLGPDEVWDNDVTLQMHHLAIRFRTDPGNSGFRNQSSLTLIPAADGRYWFGADSGEGSDPSVQLHASGLLDPSEVIHNPLDPDADQNGLVLQAWHNIDWVDDAGSDKGPPAIKNGQVWGMRYTIGLHPF